MRMRKLLAGLMVGVLAAVVLPAVADKAPQTQSAAVSSKWEKAIAQFEAEDKVKAPPQDAILFTGASTIRMWKTLAQDFPDHKVINRGFGGSQISDSVQYIDRVSLPYHPKAIVLHAGANDLAAGKSPERVAADLQEYVTKVRAKLPEVRIIFFGITPSPSRWSQRDKQQKANALIKTYLATVSNTDFIELWAEFLGPDGAPREDLFLKDRLHSNAEGYKIRADVVRPHLK